MKVVPKYARGGYADFFTVYEALPRTAREKKKKKKDDDIKWPWDADSKGKLTEKDFFQMMKDIDGLPNDMSDIVSELMETFSMQTLTGIADTTSLADMYLQNLYQIKVAAQNKERFDTSVKEAKERGALYEPAITPDGKLVVQNQDGSMASVDLETYLSSPTEYTVLSVSNLASMRKYDPALAFNQDVFDIMDNSMGFEAFQKMVSSAVGQMKDTENTYGGLFDTNQKGLALLETLRQDDRVRALGSVTAEGLYAYKVIDRNQKDQIESMLRYLVQSLPDSAKTWAALKRRNPNKEQATAELITDYLLGNQQVTHSFDIQYKGTEKDDESSGSRSSGSKKSDKSPEEGFWWQVIRGQGGQDFKYQLLKDKGRISANAKYYGTTPGLDENKSLGQFMKDSKVGYLIRNNNNITFGDTKISKRSFDDVMVNAYGGAAVATLPVKPDGTVDLSVADTWLTIQDKLEDEGYVPGSAEFNQKMKQRLHDANLDTLYDQDGNLRKDRSSMFLILEGYTSERAMAVQGAQEIGFGDVKSDYILPAGDDDATYDMIRRALSGKTKEERYELDSGWLFSDDLYKGNIYIPLNNNPINANNADDNEITTKESNEYEKAQQQQSTNSDLL